MITSQVYSEVYEILNTLGKEYINKLPIKLYEHIESQRDKNMEKHKINYYKY